MSFEATRTLIVLGAATTGYVIEHPQLIDLNLGNPLTRGLRNTHVEATNQTASTAYIAFDRAVVAPVGNGVQGVISALNNPNTGPIAATPGDFDIAVPSATGWSAVDFVIPYGSRSMTVFTVGAGAVLINYGLNDNG